MAYNTDWGKQVDSAFVAKGLPVGSGAALLGVENASGSLNAVSSTGVRGLLQQTNGFMQEWNPGGSVANPNDNITAASNFFAAQQSAGYTPAEAYVMYQQGTGLGQKLFNTDPSTPISALSPSEQNALVVNGCDPNGTVGDAVNHIEGQYGTGAGYANNAGLDTSGVPNTNRTPPQGNNAKTGTQSGGTSFGGAGCASAGMSPAALMAAAAVASGAGLGANALVQQMAQGLATGGITGAASAAMSAAGGAVNQALNAATGGISNAVSGNGNALNSISGGAFQAISQMGSNILPSLTGVLPGGINGLLKSALVGGLRGGVPGMMSGALNNVVSGVVGNMVGPLNGVLGSSTYPNAIQQFAAAGGLSGMIQKVAKNMVGGSSGNVNNFVNNMGMASAFSAVANNVVGGTAEATALKFGTVTNGIGANYTNNNDVISYGATSISRNLSGSSVDFLNLGKFSTKDLLRLQQPGSVAKQILNAGLGKSIGLIKKMTDANIPIAGVDNPLNDTKILQILSSINDQTSCETVSAIFNLKKPIFNLGQLCDYNYMCPTLSQTSPSKNFLDLGQQLISLGMTKAETFEDIGIALAKLDPGYNLQYLSQSPTLITEQASNTLMQTYGYGGGTIGEITMADFIGTAAGYIHTDSLPYIIDANNKIAARLEGQVLTSLLNQLNLLLTGGYFAPGSSGSGSGGGGPIQDALYFNGKTYTSLDSAILDAVDAIEAQLTVIASINDPDIQNALKAAEIAHAASCAQIIKENHYITTYGMNLFENSSNTPLSAYVFASGLASNGQDNGYGKIGDYIEKVATDNIYGDSIKAALRMGRNSAVLAPLGVNVDRFSLPHSQYYRNPSAFYIDAYTGNLPLIPLNLQDQVIPQTSGDTYVELRNKLLSDNGYNPTQMLPAQADETYYDLQWSHTNPAVLENIGLNIVQDAINRNTFIIGNTAYIIDLNGSQQQFATIDQRGMFLTNNDQFIGTMFSIINKMLYGNIGTTKYNTPFFTDQMVYGVLELLSQVTPHNIDGLASTLLGSAILPKFMEKLRLQFQQITQITNTAMDRNISNSWGGSGPDGNTIIKK